MCPTCGARAKVTSRPQAFVALARATDASAVDAEEATIYDRRTPPDLTA